MLKLSLVVSLLTVSDHGTQSVTHQVEYAIIFHRGKTLTELLFANLLDIGTKLTLSSLRVYEIEQIAVLDALFIDFSAWEQVLKKVKIKCVLQEVV